MVSSKRIDPKKKRAQKSIVNLVHCLPSDTIQTWLTVSEIWTLLVNGGIAAEIDDAVVRFAMQGHSRGQFESRRFGKSHENFYRHASCAGDPTTPDCRQTVC